MRTWKYPRSYLGRYAVNFALGFLPFLTGALIMCLWRGVDLAYGLFFALTWGAVYGLVRTPRTRPGDLFWPRAG